MHQSGPRLAASLRRTPERASRHRQLTLDSPQLNRRAGGGGGFPAQDQHPKPWLRSGRASFGVHAPTSSASGPTTRISPPGKSTREDAGGLSPPSSLLDLAPSACRARESAGGMSSSPLGSSACSLSPGSSHGGLSGRRLPSPSSLLSASACGARSDSRRTCGGAAFLCCWLSFSNPALPAAAVSADVRICLLVEAAGFARCREYSVETGVGVRLGGAT